MMSKSVKKLMALLLSLLLVLNGLVSLPAFAETPSAIAAWDYSAAPASASVPATSGANMDGAILTNSKSITPAYSSSSLSVSGWDNGIDTKYWQIGFSSKGFENLTINARSRSSGTGPRDFKLIYSIDGGSSWNDIPNSAYKITGTTLKDYMPIVALPADTANRDNLLIRFVMTSNISSRAGTSTYPAEESVQPGGTSNINNILVSGTPTVPTSSVAPVSASPAGGSVALGSKVSLSCATEGATILYSVADSVYSSVSNSVYAPDNNGFLTYDPASQITLNTLPATIKAYAAKSGIADSLLSSWSFTQAQVPAVSATPNGGAIEKGSQITLSCSVQDAAILYSLNNGQTWDTYSTPLTVTSLPLTLQAYAIKSGLLDSTKPTFNFTQKVSGEPGLYFGQLHSHTNNSDGVGTLDDAFSHAKDAAKLDFFAVTDHSNSLESTATATMGDGSSSSKWIAGRAAADKYTDSSFVGIYGFEMTWSNGIGHINTFNTPGFENRNNSVYTAADGLQKYYNVLKQFPASISQFNHPGSTFGDFRDFAYYDPQIDHQISLIEVGNGEGAIRSSGYFPSYEYYTRALDKGWHVAPTNNQDNHKGLWGDANTGRTVVLADSLTRNSIYDAMRNMHIYATEDQNLRIKYTLNNQVMGTILPEKPAAVDIKIDLEDPDNEAIGAVSVIANGGKVVANKSITGSKDTLNFTLDPNYSYYYIRVDEADKDIAVTAPVWIGEVDRAGISKSTGSTSLPVKGESFRITTELYNNESVPMSITSLEYSISGNIIHTAPALSAVNSLSTASYSFDYTPDAAGSFNVDVKLTAAINGIEKIYTDVLKLKVADPAMVSKVIIDASHFNDYVGGYYANNMNNITTLANSQNIQVVLQKDPLTDAVLANAQLLLLTPPAKKSGTASGISYTAKPYTDEEIAVIKRYAESGGNIIVTALADYQDSRTDPANHSAYQQNRVLEAIGATSRINDDEVVDYDSNPNVSPAGIAGGTPYRIPMNTYNMESPYLAGVQPGQNYSFYSGCSFTMGPNATWLVKAYPTTYGFDSDNDKLGGAYVAAANKTIPSPDGGVGKGNVAALAEETLPGGGILFIGGTVFFSDFEIKAALDNYTQLQNSNYNITMNILNSKKKVLPVTPIQQIRSGQTGNTFCAEGIVTAGTIPGNAFFDTIYIQDATGGINIFPVSGMELQVGQKVKVTGTLDAYQGEKELRVIRIEVTDTSINPATPAELSTKDAMDNAHGGLLVKIKGKVDKVDVTNGVVSQIFVTDESGVQARLFIDGYIGYSNTSGPKLEDIVQIGNVINGIGLASTDPDGNRLRVRDRSEIVLLHTAGELADLEAANAVMAKINALPEVITLSDKATVVAARTAYNALTPAQQLLVTNLNKLAGAENAISALEHNQAAVNDVIAKINAIPSELKLSDKAVIVDARNAYNALTPEQQVQVINLDKLISAESMIARLESEKAVANVIAKINAIPAIPRLSDKQKVLDARSAYDALTAGQKALVTNYSKLQAAESIIAKLENIKAAAEVMAKINAIPLIPKLSDKQQIIDTRNAFDALTADQKRLVLNLYKLEAAEAFIAKLEANKAAADAVIEKINALPEKITLEDKDAVQSAKAAYNSLTFSQKLLVTNISKLLAAEIQIAKLDKAKADGVTAMIKSIHNPVRLSDQQAVKDARAAYDTLSSDQKKLVSNLKKLIQAEERIQKLLEKEKRN